MSEHAFRFWIEKFVRYIHLLTKISRLPNRLDLIIAGPVDSGISLYDLLNKIKRESIMKIQSFVKANCCVDSLSLVKLSFAKITRVLCLHAEMRPMLK